MKVFYHLDDDGKCAGYWVKKSNKLKDDYNNEYFKINYGMDFPINSIKKDEIVYIVDYSISPNEMDELLKITKNVIWIDHHKSAIEKYSGYDKKIAGLRYDGMAGCMLTYIYLNYMTDKTGRIINEFDPTFAKAAPWFTKLIADYDVWAFKYGKITRNFQKGFELYPRDPEEKIWEELLYEEITGIDEKGILRLNILDKIINKGEIIISYRKRMMAEYCKNKGFEAELDKYKCFAVNMAMINSDDFVIDNVDDYDVLIGFSFDGEKWAYSLRSEKVDCSELASKYGGGGHKGAAGFSSTDFVLNKITGED